MISVKSKKQWACQIFRLELSWLYKRIRKKIVPVEQGERGYQSVGEIKDGVGSPPHWTLPGTDPERNGLRTIHLLAGEKGSGRSTPHMEVARLLTFVFLSH